MAYISRQTGKDITEHEHIQQSVDDLFTTPLGSRVRVRDYGFPMDLIDQPLNQSTTLKIYIAAAKILKKWEPRISLHRLQAEISKGSLKLHIFHARGLVSTTVGYR